MKRTAVKILCGVLIIFSLAITRNPARAYTSLAQGTEPPAVVTTAPPTEEPTASPTEEPSGPRFSVSADASSKSGIPGAIVTYTITVQNLTESTLEITIDAPVSVSGWTPAPTVETGSLTLPASGSSTFTMDVPIPSGASVGQNDKERVSISDGITVSTVTVSTTVKSGTVAGRPMLVISSYSINSGKVAAGSDFELAIQVKNSGQSNANNIVIAFDGGTSFYPKASGGIAAITSLASGKSKTVTQKFTGSSDLYNASLNSIKVTISYTDPIGTAYSDVFTLTINADSNEGSGTGIISESGGSEKPQLVVTGYSTDVDILQPGTSFTLNFTVRNMGSTDANAVTMVLGGSGGDSSGESGTPSTGGVSGTGGGLTNFAPLNSSNLVYIGNIKRESETSFTQKLIVNVSTEPGVYTLNISFVYTDAKGNSMKDDQVITLLVYSLPKLDISFYRDPGVFTVGMDNILPIQVTNLGKKTSVLGNMTVTAEGEEVANNVSLVGALDPGGYYTLDADIIPTNEGPLDVLISINYNDDFNQPRTFEQKITIDVQPAPEAIPQTGLVDEYGNPISPDDATLAPETFWQKILRFFKGLFGLDSGAPGQENTIIETTPQISPYKG